MGDPTVADVMTTPVLTVTADERTLDVAAAMADQSIKSVVIVDAACQPEGILTSTDYVRMTADGVDPTETTVREHMSREIITTSPDTALSAVASTMRGNDISHVPVVDDETTVTGILSATDLTGYLADG
ncbi:CBS domain-containing protein [Haloarcula sp. 1CSR25-25]|uniref:CBS domain-containing protein n=1 Tax=Haloarcula sp. 1CSR25-25 TaxID=2862545 RepID=UPI002893BB17|nr:CBS domain-containing protein [Haloarcula sp. 1CSR25-25]MDT3435593.1 CBS domain-containing protein [Haloarcula sp. 1CSR25-25]